MEGGEGKGRLELIDSFKKYLNLFIVSDNSIMTTKHDVTYIRRQYYTAILLFNDEITLLRESNQTID
jgi:hypothetical protein